MGGPHIAALAILRPRACSSNWQSSGLLIRSVWVRVPPGPPRDLLLCPSSLESHILSVTNASHHLFGLLRSLDLPMGDFAVFGSGPLIVRGIIEAANDLDVVSRGRAWERALVLESWFRFQTGP